MEILVLFLWCLNGLLTYNDDHWYLLWRVLCHFIFFRLFFNFCWYSNFYNLCLVGFSFPISQDYIELFVQMLSKFFQKNKIETQPFSFWTPTNAVVYLYSVDHNPEIIALHKNCHLWLLRVVTVRTLAWLTILPFQSS